MRDMFVRTLLEIAKRDPNVHLLTGDLGFGVLKPFWEQLPEQITNVGIAEQNMTSFAAGMALEGKIVFTYSIGNFPTLRCIEQIRNDCAYHNANVKIVCVGGGFVYGPLGMSHHATEDIAIMRALPQVTVLAPGDLIEASLATKAIYHTSGTCYLRLGRGGEIQVHDETLEFNLGKAIKIKDGKGIVLITTGAILDEVMEVIEDLVKRGYTPALYSFPTIKPIDKDTIHYLATHFDTVVTVEEHNIMGGFYSAIAEVIVQHNKRLPYVIPIGIQDTYSTVVGSQKYLRDFYGLSSKKILDRIISTMNSL